jgi:quercetin dioxygenase-like cupin family protein
MTTCRRILFAAVALVAIAGCSDPTSVAANPATEIDAVIVAPERFKVLVENEHVRVIEYALAPGEKDTPHTHPPKVSYVVSGGKLRIYAKDGESFEADEATGAARWDEARPWHYVENTGDTPVRILLVEVKSAANKKSQ